MRTWHKVVLGLLAVFVVGIALLAGAGLLFARYLRQEIGSDAEQHVTTGRNEGRDRSARQCLADAEARDTSGQAFKEIMASSLRLAGCLRSSKTDDALCDEVPFKANAIQQAVWSAARCRERPSGDVACSSRWQVVTTHCRSTQSARDTAAP